MRYALPGGESAIVERGVFACLGGGVAALALLLALDAARRLGLDAAPGAAGGTSLLVLAPLLLAFALAFGLVTAGTMPRARRVRFGLALACATLAAATTSNAAAVSAMVPTLAVAVGLALAAPPRTQRWAWAGATMIALYAGLRRIDAETLSVAWLATPLSARAWGVVPAIMLVVGMGVVAVAYARGVAHARARG